MAGLNVCHLEYVPILSLKSKLTSQLQLLTPLSELHCSTEVSSEESPDNFPPNYTHTYSCTMQAKAAETDVEPLLCESKTTSNRSWLNHGLFTWIIHGWIMAGCGATGQQGIVPAKHLLRCLVTCGGADEIKETEFESRRFLRFQCRKLSTNQN